MEEPDRYRWWHRFQWLTQAAPRVLNALAQLLDAIHHLR
jgi:hypothetical protein